MNFDYYAVVNKPVISAGVSLFWTVLWLIRMCIVGIYCGILWWQSSLIFYLPIYVFCFSVQQYAINVHADRMYSGWEQFTTDMPFSYFHISYFLFSRWTWVCLFPSPLWSQGVIFMKFFVWPYHESYITPILWCSVSVSKLAHAIQNGIVSTVTSVLYWVSNWKAFTQLCSYHCPDVRLLWCGLQVSCYSLCKSVHCWSLTGSDVTHRLIHRGCSQYSFLPFLLH